MEFAKINSETKKLSPKYRKFFLGLVFVLLLALMIVGGFFAAEMFYKTSYKLVSVFLVIIFFSNLLSRVALEYLKTDRNLKI